MDAERPDLRPDGDRRDEGISCWDRAILYSLVPTLCVGTLVPPLRGD